MIDFKNKIAALRSSFKDAVSDAIDDPKKLSLAESIKSEIAKLESQQEIAEIQATVLAERAEAARLAEEAARQAAIRKEIERIAAEAVSHATKADAALAELMAEIIAFQTASAAIMKLDPNKRSVLTLRDRTRLTRACFGQQLADGKLIADYFDMPRPAAILRGSSIVEFVRAHLQ